MTIMVVLQMLALLSLSEPAFTLNKNVDSSQLGWRLTHENSFVLSMRSKHMK